MPASEKKKNAGNPPLFLPLAVLKRNALNRTGGNTPPYNRASGIYWRQRIPSFEPCHKSIMETTNQLHTSRLIFTLKQLGFEKHGSCRAVARGKET